jgi:hypothetical protein
MRSQITRRVRIDRARHEMDCGATGPLRSAIPRGQDCVNASAWRGPPQPRPAGRWRWILWVLLLVTLASTSYTMNRALAASRTSFIGLEPTGADECRNAWPSRADGGPRDACNGEQIGRASFTTCAGGTRPDSLRQADEVELRWLLNECSPQPPRVMVGNGDGPRS